MSKYFNKGFAVYALRANEAWQFAVFTIGHEVGDDDDHEAYPLVTWYVQFAFWQFSYSREVPPKENR